MKQQISGAVEPPPVKPWYQSKTMLINGVVIVASLLIAVLEVFRQNGYQFTPEAITAMLLAAANLVLRLQTNSGVTLATPPPTAPPLAAPDDPQILDG